MAKKADLLKTAKTLKLKVTDKNTIAEIETAIKGHTAKPAVAKKIASREGISMTGARAILAAGTRHASTGAHDANPRLARVKGK